MSDLSSIVHEFLVESCDNLDQLDRDLLALDASPGERAAMASIFRTIHTIRGTAGFLGFHQLEALTGAGEELLSRLRDGMVPLTPVLRPDLDGLAAAVRQMLANIQSSGHDGENSYSALVARLRAQSGADASSARPRTTTPVAATASPAPNLTPQPMRRIEPHEVGPAANADHSLVVSVQGHCLALPVSCMQELILLEHDDEGALFEELPTGTIFRRGQALWPVARLAKMLGLPATEADACHLIAIHCEGSTFCAEVDEIVGLEPIRCEALPKSLASLSLYQGQGRTQDGRIALVLDPAELATSCGVRKASERAGKRGASSAQPGLPAQSALAVVSAGTRRRVCIPLGSVERVEEFARTSIHRDHARTAGLTGEAESTSYRGRSLPVLRLSHLLGTVAATSGDPARTLICCQGDARFGLVVDEVHEITAERLIIQCPQTDEGLLLSCVAGNESLSVLDLATLFSGLRSHDTTSLRAAA